MQKRASPNYLDTVLVKRQKQQEDSSIETPPPHHLPHNHTTKHHTTMPPAPQTHNQTHSHPHHAPSPYPIFPTTTAKPPNNTTSPFPKRENQPCTGCAAPTCLTCPAWIIPSCDGRFPQLTGSPETLARYRRALEEASHMPLPEEDEDAGAPGPGTGAVCGRCDPPCGWSSDVCAYMKNWKSQTQNQTRGSAGAGGGMPLPSLDGGWGFPTTFVGSAPGDAYANVMSAGAREELDRGTSRPVPDHERYRNNGGVNGARREGGNTRVDGGMPTTVAKCYPGDAYSHVFTPSARAELDRAAELPLPDR
ncbi:hypothetical protein P280DRAFT_292245 [Massarina eburnea CBS 473.64]|uniref:Uncharacterized protein n=1 Tax=Massarina eburnea CBS 473.64 TaxID=1395130 RepID=A0A6A6S4J9_9PLEO|nr:hypothetical protein P280DRAFT_292245 [Massarina eburnea CBS 473.64]